MDTTEPVEDRGSGVICPSVQARLNWAYDELAPAAQILLRWLATDYQPSAPLVAEALGGCLGLAPRGWCRLIQGLLAGRLLQPHPGYPGWFLLHEEIRGFLLTKLGPDEEMAARIALATARRAAERGADGPTNPHGIAYQQDARLDGPLPSPDWPAYCAEIAAAALPLAEDAADGAGVHPLVQPDLPPPAALGHGLLARHWQALWPGDAEREPGPAMPEPPR